MRQSSTSFCPKGGCRVICSSAGSPAWKNGYCALRYVPQNPKLSNIFDCDTSGDDFCFEEKQETKEKYVGNWQI